MKQKNINKDEILLRASQFKGLADKSRRNSVLQGGLTSSSAYNDLNIDKPLTRNTNLVNRSALDSSAINRTIKVESTSLEANSP